jgi:hypothetical protein
MPFVFDNSFVRADLRLVWKSGFSCRLVSGCRRKGFLGFFNAFFLRNNEAVVHYT